jgi:hypothetical protein
MSVRRSMVCPSICPATWDGVPIMAPARVASRLVAVRW